MIKLFSREKWWGKTPDIISFVNVCGHLWNHSKKDICYFLSLLFYMLVLLSYQLQEQEKLKQNFHKQIFIYILINTGEKMGLSNITLCSTDSCIDRFFINEEISEKVGSHFVQIVKGSMEKAGDLKISALDALNYHHCELFVTYVDRFYEEIKKYGIIHQQLTPLPDSIACVFQMSVNKILGPEPEPGTEYTITFSTRERPMSTIELAIPILIGLGVASAGVFFATQANPRYKGIIAAASFGLGALASYRLISTWGNT